MLHRIFLVLLSILLAGCDETPTGRSRLALVPESVLLDFGAQAFDEMKQANTISHDPADNALVHCVTDHITTAAATRFADELPETYEVVVFDDPTPNAFVMPGGKIGVHTSLLRLSANQAQLAAVLGHEVAHLIADHGNERLTQQLGVSGVLVAVGLFVEVDNQMLMNALGMGAQLGVILPFSRIHETEADLLGLEIMAMAGFDPQESVVLWKNMALAGDAQPVEFLSAHPGHETRVAHLAANMAPALALYEQSTHADCAPPAHELDGPDRQGRTAGPPPFL